MGAGVKRPRLPVTEWLSPEDILYSVVNIDINTAMHILIVAKF